MLTKDQITKALNMLPEGQHLFIEGDRMFNSYRQASDMGYSPVDEYWLEGGALQYKDHGLLAEWGATIHKRTWSN